MSRESLGVAALVLLGALGPSPLPAQDGRWEQTLEDGERALAARDYELAHVRFESALEQAQAFQDEDPRKLTSLVRMARAYRASGDYAEPERLYGRALGLARRIHKEETVELADLIFEVGRYYHTRRKYEEAERYYREAFSSRVRLLGREHAKVAESINNLAVLYENQARFAKAVTYYETALKIREKILGPEHLQTAITCEHFARLLHKLQRDVEAQKLERRARAVRAPLVEQAAGPRVDVGEVYTQEPGLRPPELEEQTEPEYTVEARIARHEGAALLEVEIDAQGRAQNVKVIRPLGLGLDEKAIESVRSWRFKPARYRGKKVAFRTRLEIQFQLL